MKYLVLWNGYAREEATWVHEEDITAVTIIFAGKEGRRGLVCIQAFQNGI